MNFSTVHVESASSEIYKVLCAGVPVDSVRSHSSSVFEKSRHTVYIRPTEKFLISLDRERRLSYTFLKPQISIYPISLHYRSESPMTHESGYE